jgi:hypothetical protein
MRAVETTPAASLEVVTDEEWSLSLIRRAHSRIDQAAP